MEGQFTVKCANKERGAAYGSVHIFILKTKTNVSGLVALPNGFSICSGVVVAVQNVT